MDKSSSHRVTLYTTCHRSQRALVCALITAVIVISGISAATAQNIGREALAENTDGSLPAKLVGQFSTLYEPSGVVPVPDGRFLMVEDEPGRALRLLTADISSHSLSFREESQLRLPASLSERLSVGVLDDLEGTAHDQQGRLYVVSSHDDAAPYWISKRQKLLRFSVKDGQMHDVARKLTLRRDLLASYPQLENGKQDKSRKKPVSMNIEALAYDRSRDVLLIGFRTPVLDGKAIVIRLMNPDAYLRGDAPADLGEAPWLVDLDKGGLRAMTYDDQSDQLLMIARRENHKDDAYKLWRMAANGQEPAVQIEMGEQEEMLDRVEGLASISLGQSLDTALLLVRDNGNARKGQGAEWFVVRRKLLGLEPRLH